MESQAAHRRMFLKTFIPPLLPVVALVALCGWVIVSPADQIDGHLDNAPIHAAGLLVFLSPAYFLLCFFLNMIDQLFDSERGWLVPWMCSLLFCFVIAAVFAWGSFSEARGALDVEDVVFPLLMVALTILPMSLLRRLFGWQSSRPSGGLWQRFVGSLGDL